MNRFLVCSDIHGKIENFRYALTEAKGEAQNLDGIIIAGDVESEVNEIKDVMNSVLGVNADTKTGLYLVKGNCDWGNLFGATDMITFCLSEEVNVMLTHGHKYQVKSDLDTLQYVAEYRKANLCIYGHTHRFDDRTINGVRYINPGALCGGYDMPSYIILTVDGSNIDIVRRSFR